MAAKKTQWDSQGNLIVNLDKPYSFRSPRGRDLVTIQKLSSEGSMTPIELTGCILSALSNDQLTLDDILDLPADVLLELGEAVTSNFRVFRTQTV